MCSLPSITYSDFLSAGNGWKQLQCVTWAGRQNFFLGVKMMNRQEQEGRLIGLYINDVLWAADKLHSIEPLEHSRDCSRKGRYIPSLIIQTL